MLMQRIVLAGSWMALVFLFSAPGARSGPRPSEHTLPDSKKDCSLCHRQHDGAKPGLRKGLSALCLDCHQDRVAPAEHKVDIVPTMDVGGLPLTEGRMTCVTCHDPHRNAFGSLLRKKETDLCLSCHPL